MEQMAILKQIIDFNKATFDNSFKAMAMVQEQTEKMLYTFLEATPWLTEDGKKVIREWIKSYEKGRDDFKKYADDSFKQVEGFLAGAEKSKKATTKKTSLAKTKKTSKA